MSGLSDKDRKDLEGQLKAREDLLLPIYHQVAVQFADLHDNPTCLLEKGAISVRACSCGAGREGSVLRSRVSKQEVIWAGTPRVRITWGAIKKNHGAQVALQTKLNQSMGEGGGSLASVCFHVPRRFQRQQGLGATSLTSVCVSVTAGPDWGPFGPALPSHSPDRPKPRPIVRPQENILQSAYHPAHAAPLPSPPEPSMPLVSQCRVLVDPRLCHLPKASAAWSVKWE